MTAIQELLQRMQRNIRIGHRKVYPLPAPEEGQPCDRYEAAKAKRARRRLRNVHNQESEMRT
jgi:hypothetical protein